MLDVLKAAEIGMLNDVQRMQILSNNLANVNTAGYKKEVAVARPFMDKLRVAESQTSDANRTYTVVRPSLGTYTDRSASTVKYTGNPLDISVDNGAMFVVQSDQGLAYATTGSLQIDATGRLLTSSGAPVLGSHGEIVLSTATPTIDGVGNILADGKIVDRMRSVSIADKNALVKLGQGLYSAEGATVEEDPLGVHIRQGYLETSNVSVTDEMVKMIEIVRHFESCQRSLKAYDAMLDQAINTIGQF